MKHDKHGNYSLRPKRATLALAALAAGGMSASLVASGASATTTPHATMKVVVSTATNSKVGTVLSDGKTLYALIKPSKTACTSACLKIWPALLLPKGVTKASAGAGVSQAKLGVVSKSGGRQVTYNSKALYWFTGDTKAGQVNGDVTDTWGTWAAIVTKAKTGTSSSGSGSGSGSGAGTNTGTGGVAF